MAHGLERSLVSDDVVVIVALPTGVPAASRRVLMRLVVADLNSTMNEASDRGLSAGTKRWGSLRQDVEGK
ncbi:MAG: hypothetical protein WBG32_05450 [Nodosilinea sp.]